MRIGFFRGFLAAAALAVLPAIASAGIAIGVSVNIAPPAIPIYVQPPCPVAGYLWVPGYWAWGAAGYYWVPGTWVLPPRVGLLWTPGYWGWWGGAYVWHAGYWGPHVGFYGGIHYGFGYTGVGFAGGYWRGNAFFYNRAVANVTNVRVTNVYERTVVNRVSVTRVSYNGGAGGVMARPTAVERAAARERHVAFTPMQREHMQFAARDVALRASANGGRPAIAATARPGQFTGHGVIAARSAGHPERVGADRGERFDRPRAAGTGRPPAERFNHPQARQFDRPSPGHRAEARGGFGARRVENRPPPREAGPRREERDRQR